MIGLDAIRRIGQRVIAPNRITSHQRNSLIMSLFFRRISILLGILALVGAFFVSKQLSSKKAPPKKKENPVPVIREVEVFKVQNGSASSQMEVQGSLAAYNKVDIFAEVTGMLRSTTKPFKIGTYFKKGETLLDIEKEEATLTVLSQKSSLINTIMALLPDLKIDYPQSYPQWGKYVDNFDVNSPIQPLPVALSDQEKYFIGTKNLSTQYYTIKSAEKRLSKYKVYAPFSGVITETMITPGSLVRAGQKTGSLMQTGDYELQATVNLSDLKYIKKGTKVLLYSDAVEGNWKGTVRRVSDLIDPNTQSVVVFIGVKGRDLREGMYLKGKLNTQSVNNALAIPLDLLVNQNQVYKVENGQLRLQNITVLNTNATQAIVQDIADGTLLVKNKMVGAFEGMEVKPIELTASK